MPTNEIGALSGAGAFVQLKRLQALKMFVSGLAADNLPCGDKLGSGYRPCHCAALGNLPTKCPGHAVALTGRGAVPAAGAGQQFALHPTLAPPPAPLVRPGDAGLGSDGPHPARPLPHPVGLAVRPLQRHAGRHPGGRQLSGQALRGEE